MPAPPIPPTTAETLPGLLLSAADVGRRAGRQGRRRQRRGQRAVERRDAFPERRRRRDAWRSPAPPRRRVYADAGWTALHGQVLREPPTAQQWSHFATQAVVLFRDAAAASGFLARSARAGPDAPIGSCATPSHWRPIRCGRWARRAPNATCSRCPASRAVRSTGSASGH